MVEFVIIDQLVPKEHLLRKVYAENLTVQPLDHVVGTAARPVLAGEVTVGQRLLNAILDLLGGFLCLLDVNNGRNLHLAKNLLRSNESGLTTTIKERRRFLL